MMFRLHYFYLQHLRHKQKKDSRTFVLLSLLNFVGVTRFELATTRPPDVYSNRAELHPELCRSKTMVRFRSANIVTIFIMRNFFSIFFAFFYQKCVLCSF